MLTGTPLIYSDHAQARMVDRAIYKKQVRRTLRRPYTLYSRGLNQIAEYRTSGGAVVRVVYRLAMGAPVNSLLVVTVVRLGRHRRASQNAPIDTLYDCALDVAYVGLLSGRIAETVEVSSGVFYDLDNCGEIMGVEILDYSRYRDDEGKSLSIFERLPMPTH